MCISFSLQGRENVEIVFIKYANIVASDLAACSGFSSQSSWVSHLHTDKMFMGAPGSQQPQGWRAGSQHRPEDSVGCLLWPSQWQQTLGGRMFSGESRTSTLCHLPAVSQDVHWTICWWHRLSPLYVFPSPSLQLSQGFSHSCHLWGQQCHQWHSCSPHIVNDLLKQPVLPW